MAMCPVDRISRKMAESLGRNPILMMNRSIGFGSSIIVLDTVEVHSATLKVQDDRFVVST
jgi:hypothetical protein